MSTRHHLRTAVLTRTIALLATLLVCLAPGAFAQPAAIVGTVVDDRTGQPMKEVLIYIENETAFGESDVDGRFTLNVRGGRHTVVATLIGYAMAKIDVTADGSPVTIRLSEGAGA